MAERFFEDFAVGQRFRSGTAGVSADQIKSFAAELDPQPFHLDDKAAGVSFFAGLAASGWHTAAIVMRLIDVEGEVLELRASRSRPELGIVKIRATAFNQTGEPVQISTPVLMVKRRPSSS